MGKWVRGAREASGNESEGRRRKRERESERSECDGARIREKDRVVLYEAGDVFQDRKSISRILRDMFR